MLVVRLDNGLEQKWSFGGSILSTPPQLCFSSSLLFSSLTLFSPLPLSLRDSQLNGVDWPIKEKGRDGSKQWSALGWLVGESSGFRPNNATRGHGT